MIKYAALIVIATMWIPLIYFWLHPFVRFYILKQAKVGDRFISKPKDDVHYLSSIVEIIEIVGRKIYVKFVEIDGVKINHSLRYDWDIWGFFTIFKRINL